MGKHQVTGSFIKINDEEYYKISNYQEMKPFFISVASNSDIWMFMSSNGALAGGRKNSDRSIFPYETDDRIHLSTSTGPKTIVRIIGSDTKVWEPFDKSVVNPYVFKRNLYKNSWGNAVIYEEINETLQLSFCYKWESSEMFGLVRTSWITNLSENDVVVEVLDGVLNIMPYGVTASFVENSSCLIDAYKVADYDRGVAIYSLSSKINDVPEPVEILRANAAWGIFNTDAKILLSDEHIKDFSRGENISPAVRSQGKKTAYLSVQNINLKANEKQQWLTVLDCCLNQATIAELQSKLANKNELCKQLNDDILQSTEQLKEIIASADGMQLTNDSEASRHHFVNVLYNCMRGGVFDDGYSFDFDELVSFVNVRNKGLYERNVEFFEKIKANPSVLYLKQCAFESTDADLARTCIEFMPICFSRRHGDPSRPWNRFFINLKSETGKKIYHYEGNWRDIFQNWESMCMSFPEYFENVIAKFLNASTADGYNPYRLNKEGIDWEAPEPHNPFSGLGYWGDHQIIYLLKLLEALNTHNPSAFDAMQEKDIYCYANVPYRIKSYADICSNSKNTIVFDFDAHEKIMEKAATLGTDGKLLLDSNDKPYNVSFVEKLLVPILAKMANLVVGGGIWLNTQRPEWNDANNALVGNGLSMVTVYQLRRHLSFCIKLLNRYKDKQVKLSNEVLEFANGVKSVLDENSAVLKTPEMNVKKILDGLGNAFGEYRAKVYEKGLSGKTDIAYTDIISLLEISLTYIDYTIELSKREDGLYNSYNVMEIKNESVIVKPMFPMLEGQTSVLGSGKLSPKEALELISIMEKGAMYSEEQKSFYLYPIKTLKTFMQKNIVSAGFAERSELISTLIKNGDSRLVSCDVQGNVRLNEDIVQLSDLKKVMDELKNDSRYAQLVTNEYDAMCDEYDEIFKHKEFTGRSGIMYKYEGIGCIYWHQNAKFLLSVEEIFLDPANKSCPELRQLKDTYYRLREGLGFTKKPNEFGAFPLDPYSHTPYLQGAQQPGMTGQVKEEILTRRFELGIIVDEGKIKFEPSLLRKPEFLEASAEFEYYDLCGNSKRLMLEKGELAFTLCQIPVIYRLASSNKITFVSEGQQDVCINSLALDEALSKRVFLRDKLVNKIVVEISEDEII